jgi:two-component system OmpR family sensor kinase
MPSLGRLVRRRTLSARLIIGVLVLLTGACAVIGVVTYLVVRHSMVSSLDNQLRRSSGNYVSCIERAQDASQQGSHDGGPGGGYNPAPDMCSRGQPQGMLGIRFYGGKMTICSIVNEENQQRCPALPTAEKKALLALPVFHPPVPPDQQPSPQGTPDAQPSTQGSPYQLNAPSYTLDLTVLGGDYRLTSFAGVDGDILLTGLPMSDVEHTIGQLAITELIVFLSVLLLAGVLGTVLVRVSLRPLRRVAATATLVTELPLDAGNVSLPDGVPDTDPRTEVGQVGAAFNRMLGHVERALGRRAASEARLRRFAADASHELRTPLSAIRGYAELALRHPGPVPEEVTHALSRVQSESARMSVLVDDLLLLARLDAGRPLDRAPVDLTRLAIDVTSDARVARADHRWRLDLPGDPVLVEGDEHRLHQVLANLLSNAGKHTPTGSTVTVALAVNGNPLGKAAHDAVELTVTDDGPGIPEDLLPDLFERFTRADTSRARNADTADTAGGAGHSTGLGLAIVDAVVAAHGGSVTVTSHPGMTRFTVLLPLLPDHAERATSVME